MNNIHKEISSSIQKDVQVNGLACGTPCYRISGDEEVACADSEYNARDYYKAKSWKGNHYKDANQFYEECQKQLPT